MKINEINLCNINLAYILAQSKTLFRYHVLYLRSFTACIFEDYVEEFFQIARSKVTSIVSKGHLTTIKKICFFITLTSNYKVYMT